MDNLVTVLTPTYNRASELKQLYSSLEKQTNQGFIWMVIDDGSTDDTEQVMQEILPKSSFKVVYRKKPNGGKHTALNLGFQTIDTYFTFIVDSDDVLTADAIESIYQRKDIVAQKDLCGISFLRGYSADNCIGDPFPQSEAVGNDLDMRFRENVSGDKAEVWRTDILRNYRFPEFQGERFQGENYVWWQIARKYNMLYVNQIIYITEYLEGGLTKSGRAFRLKNPLGGMENCRQAFYPEFPLKIRLKYTLLYGTYGYFAGMTSGQILRSSGTAWMLLCLAPSKLLYFYWKRKFQV